MRPRRAALRRTFSPPRFLRRHVHRREPPGLVSRAGSFTATPPLPCAGRFSAALAGTVGSQRHRPARDDPRPAGRGAPARYHIPGQSGIIPDSAGLLRYRRASQPGLPAASRPRAQATSALGNPVSTPSTLCRRPRRRLPRAHPHRRAPPRCRPHRADAHPSPPTSMPDRHLRL